MPNPPPLTLLLGEPPAARATSPRDWPGAPALQTLLSKGRRLAAPDAGERPLLARFGLDAGAESPVAALLALGEGLPAEEGWWLCADPVRLEPRQDRLYLLEAPGATLRRDETEAWLAQLNDTYAGDGWRFFAPTPRYWYLRLPRAMAVETVATAEALGWDMAEVVPRGSDGMALQRLMTEIQMLFHTSETNAARERTGRAPVSGLWLWGGGALPVPHAAPPWRKVVTCDRLCAGLARLHGLEPVAAERLDDVVLPPPALWVEPARDGETPESWLARLEQALFAPLLARLRCGNLAGVDIEWPGRGAWRVRREDLRRWWRPRRPWPWLVGEEA